MAEVAENEPVVRYQFQVADDKWDRWKDTVPRSKSLEKRIIELIEADTEGRVVEPDPSENMELLADGDGVPIFGPCPWCEQEVRGIPDALDHLGRCPPE